MEDNNEIKTKIAVSNTRSTAGGTAGIRTFNFHDGAGEPGVMIGGGIRLGVLLSRLGDNSDSPTQCIHGAEAGNSPAEDYDDASLDFALENDVVYQHINPGVGVSTHSHGTDIRCNFKIFYTLIVDHGSLVGDGNVNVQHIDSGSAADGTVITADGSGGAAWEAAAGGGDTAVEVDGVAAFYTIATRILAVQVQQDNGIDFTDTATFPIASTARHGLLETATNAEATAGTAADKGLTPSNLASIFASVVSDTDLNIASPSSESTAVAPSRQAVAEAIPAFATTNPADIDDTADPGAGTTVVHANHVHRLQVDSSLEFDAAGVLGTTGTGGGGSGTGGGGYGAWEDIGSVTGAISGPQSRLRWTLARR